MVVVVVVEIKIDSVEIEEDQEIFPVVELAAVVIDLTMPMNCLSLKVSVLVQLRLLVVQQQHHGSLLSMLLALAQALLLVPPVAMEITLLLTLMRPLQQQGVSVVAQEVPQITQTLKLPLWR
jgi:hypothetical protein